MERHEAAVLLPLRPHLHLPREEAVAAAAAARDPEAVACVGVSACVLVLKIIKLNIEAWKRKGKQRAASAEAIQEHP